MASDRENESGSGSEGESRGTTPNQSDEEQSDAEIRSPSKSPSQASVGSDKPHKKDSSKSRSTTPTETRPLSSRSRSASRESNLKSPSRSRSASAESDVGGNKRKRKVLSDSSGSDAEKNIRKHKKSALIDSDSESDVPKNEEDVDATELFGDADDISSDEEERNKGGKSPASSVDDVRRGSDDEKDRDSVKRGSGSERSDDEERKEVDPEPEPEPIQERQIDVELPRIAADLGKEIHFVKLPNFLSVETRPFDPETYEDEIDEEETLDEEGRQRIKLKVSNTIRWREYLDDKGDHIKESNARMVRWSDGSMSLHLGNEIFDVYRQPLQGDHNHLFVRQGTGLQGQAVFRTKLTFRPHSTESFTHKKMTMSLADRSQKTSGIKILTQVGSDPDAHRYANLKKEEEKLRQAMRQKTTQTKQKRNRDSAAGHGNAYREDHESDDEGAISIAAIKNNYKRGANPPKQGAAIYSSDEDESDFETRRKKKPDRTKVLRALRDSDEESDESDKKATSGNESNAKSHSASGSDSG